MILDTPLIWTSKGNLPIDSLDYSYAWDDTDTYIKFSEIYKLDGEVVKESAHVRMKFGVETNSEQGVI